MRSTRLLLALAWLLSALAADAETIVRFTTSAGTILVDLYDREKPQTVQNFLRYLRSGRYRNGIAHRLAIQSGAHPGFPPEGALQGGGFIIDGGAITPIATDPPIANEFQAGPRRSNVFGTLSMARVSGNPDSATSQWFFNLGDNSAGLDDPMNSGGYTVFGRVIAGADVLQTIKTDFTDGNLQQRVIVEDENFEAFPLESGFPLVAFSLAADEIAPEVKIKKLKLVDQSKSGFEITGTARGGNIHNVLLRVVENPKSRKPKGKFTKARGKTKWSGVVSGFQRGNNPLNVRVKDPYGHTIADYTFKIELK